MASNASRGAAAKSRTKKWLQAQGYQVADLERVHWIFTPKGRLPTKRDQFGSDLLAVSHTQIRFIQVKSGKSAVGGTFPDARRKFAEFVFPPGVTCLVIAWAPRARQPRIVDCSQVGERSATSDDGSSAVRGPAEPTPPLGEIPAARPQQTRGSTQPTRTRKR